MLLIFNNDGSSNIIFESGNIVNCNPEWDISTFTVEYHNTTNENQAVWNLDGVFLPTLLLIGIINCFIEDEPIMSNPQYLLGMNRRPYALD